MKTRLLALGMVNALLLLLTGTASANGRFETDCGPFGATGHVKSHKVDCHEARKVISKFFKKAQAQGANVIVNHFDCHGKTPGREFDVLCTLRDQAIHYRGTLGRHAARGTARTVYFKDLSHEPRVKPERIAIAYGAGAYVRATDLKSWRHWGGQRTSSKGALHYNTCQPDCASSNYKSVDGVVKLDHLLECDGQPRYRQVKFNFRPHDVRDVTVNLDCDGNQVLPRAGRAERSGTIPFLPTPKAKGYMKDALKREDDFSYMHAYGKRFNDCKHVNDSRVRCSARWVIGDISFKGHIVIWFSIERGQLRWNYAYVIHRTNDYCVTTGGENCEQTYVVH